jgi:hypothetical protein
MTLKAMDRRREMQSILDQEAARWSEISAEQLLNELAEEKNYQVESNGKTYQLEVQLLEDKADYVHVLVSVDDGRLPYSIKPLCHGFIQKKARQGSEHLE